MYTRREDGAKIPSLCGRFGHFDRRFDHRQNESLDAEPVVAKVAPFRRKKAFHQMLGLCMVAQQVGEMRLRQPEEPLVLPERVIRIKADCGQILHLLPNDPGAASFLSGH